MHTLLPLDDRVRRWQWVLLAACVISLYPFLGDTLFNTRGSSREAVVALTMLKDGNWILPVNNGVDIPYKPPFLHWLMALCSLPMGHVTEWSARLPSALSLTVMVMAGYRFFARRAGIPVALLMGLVTLTAFEVHRAALSCRVDMLLAAMMVLALYALCAWVERGMRGLPWWGILCLSGAFLTKGPVGAALPCLVAAVLALARGLSAGRVIGRVAVVGLLSCILPLCWYAAAWQQGGDRFLTLIYEENVLRLLGRMSYASHENPWPYNVMTLVAGFIPYTLLVAASLFVLPYRRWRRPLREVWGRIAARLRGLDEASLFSLLSFAVIFVFYCIPKSKRSTYLLPLYPFVAYYLARYLLWLARRHRALVVGFARFIGALGLVLTLAFLAIRLGLVPDDVLGGRRPEENEAMMRSLRLTPLSLPGWVAFFVPVIAWGALESTLRRGRSPLIGLTALIFGLYFALDGVYQPLALNPKSDKPVAGRIARLVPQGTLYSYRTDVVKGNPMHPFTVNFYLGDRIVPFDARHPRSGWLLVGNDEIGDWRAAHPGYRVTRHLDLRHRSCDDHKMLHLYYFTRP